DFPKLRFAGSQGGFSLSTIRHIDNKLDGLVLADLLRRKQAPPAGTILAKIFLLIGIRYPPLPYLLNCLLACRLMFFRRQFLPGLPGHHLRRKARHSQERIVCLPDAEIASPEDYAHSLDVERAPKPGLRT